MTALLDHTAAARRFVASDKSDPFTAARVASHMRSGIAGYRQDSDAEPAFYTATAVSEMRELPNGTKYPVTAYRNVQRP